MIITPDIMRIQQRTDADCMRCCVAMALGVAYEAVPDFVSVAAKNNRGWLYELDKWLEGLGMVTIIIEGRYHGVGFAGTLPCIEIGGTERCVGKMLRHAVVRHNGIEVDPHASQVGLTNVDMTIIIANGRCDLGEKHVALNRAVQLVKQRTEDDALQCCVAMIYGVPYEYTSNLAGAVGEPSIDTDAVDRWQHTLAANYACLLERVPSPVMPSNYFNTPLIEYGVGKVTGRMHYVVRTAYDVLDPHNSALGLRQVDGVIVFHRQTT